MMSVYLPNFDWTRPQRYLYQDDRMRGLILPLVIPVLLESFYESFRLE